MKAPAFWNGQRGWLARALSPLGWIYGRVTAWRMARRGAAVGVPVICVGNFTVGGAGKTPAAILLAEMAIALGRKPFFLSRGYGGGLAGPVLVDPARHAAADCGDEPLLLARIAPVIVSRDRVSGAAEAVSRGADVLIMDDGMQNPSLRKDVVIAVVDGDAGVGNGMCLPAGPLRAPLADQMPHVDVVLVIGGAVAVRDVAAAAASCGKPVLRAVLTPDARDVEDLRGEKLLAFAGIGRPAKFFQTLRSAGLDIVLARSFADHHPYSAADVGALASEAKGVGALLVTTAKDAVRWPQDGPALRVVTVRLELAAPAAGQLRTLLSDRIRSTP
jgi:tetraacyldisaccharide 4'-kinase